MKLRHLMAVWAAAGLFAAPLSHACSLISFNDYEGRFRPIGQDLLQRSETIDWVSIEPANTWACMGFGSVKGLPAANCGDNGNTVPFTAVIRERMKGASPDQFSLFYKSAWSKGEPLLFTDLETLPYGEESFARGQRAIADARHRDPAFWDSGKLRLPTVSDGRGPCTVWVTFDTSLSYLAFRDADGAVLAMEPVLHEDDRLLQSVRAQGANSPFLEEEMSVETFFRTAGRLAYGRIRECARLSEREEKGEIDILKTDAELPYYFTPGARRDSPGLWDYFESRGERCPVGEQVLLVRMPVGHIDRAVTLADPRMQSWNSAGLRYDSPIKPVRVRQGRVYLSDIPTGLKLTGPESISVDDAFVWQAAGPQR